MPDIVYAGQRITADLLTYRSPYVVATGALTTNSSTITSSTEVTIVTTTSATFTAGRAYRFWFFGLVQHATVSLTDLIYLRLRRGSTLGSIRDIRAVPIANRGTASRNNAVDQAVLATPAATITDTVILTAGWDSGSSATFTFAGTAGTPALLTVEDVGPASDYPGIASF
jgi:hypothetical protein